MAKYRLKYTDQDGMNICEYVTDFQAEIVEEVKEDELVEMIKNYIETTYDKGWKNTKDFRAEEIADIARQHLEPEIREKVAREVEEKCIGVPIFSVGELLQRITSTIRKGER